MMRVGLGVLLPIVAGVLVASGLYGTATTVGLWTVLFWLSENVHNTVTVFKDIAVRQVANELLELRGSNG